MQGGGPTLPRRRLGQALQVLRQKAGMTGDEVATAVERSPSWVSRVESGRIGLRARDLRDLLEIYDVTDPNLQERLEALARDSHTRGWWSRYADVIPESYSIFIGLESAATSIATFENSVMPGQLQTEDYARALFRHNLPRSSDEVIEKRIAVRMRRQQSIAQRQPSPKITLVIDESVLHRPIGGADVFAAQISRAIEEAHKPYLELLVLPFASAAETTLPLAFTLMSFDGDPDVVYVETATGGVYEDEDDIPIYRQILSHLLESTLDAEASVAALREAQERIR